MSVSRTAKKSGPKTISGKKAISRNAFKHGLSASRLPHLMDNSEIKKLADILNGASKNPYVYDLALKAAEAQFEILFIRKKMLEAFEKVRTKYLPITIARQNVKSYIKAVEARFPDPFMQADLIIPFVDKQTSPYQLDDCEAMIEALKEIEKLDRYLKSAMNRRKIAMRELSEFKK